MKKLFYILVFVGLLGSNSVEAQTPSSSVPYIPYIFKTSILSSESYARLEKCLQPESFSQTCVFQVLNEYQITSFSAFLTRLKLTRNIKLSARSMCSVIIFYKQIHSWNVEQKGPTKSRRPLELPTNPTRKIDTEEARLAIQLLILPPTPLREHGTGAAPLPYTAARARQWRDFALAFREHNLHEEFLVLFSQIVNHNAGHMRWRHIESLEDRFLYDLRSFSTKPENELIGRNIFIAYLSNFHSSQAMEHKPKRGSLADFILRFSKIRNRAQLRKFFTTSQLPQSFPQYKATVIKRSLRVFKTAQQLKKDRCFEELLKLERSERAKRAKRRARK